MRVSVEYLYHFRCNLNPQHWWSIADQRVEVGQQVFCPYCGASDRVEAIDEHVVSAKPVLAADTDAE